jgi:bifunctional DNA-binding transcriptional regulator/antitoxin component of YhaV-PrlF toxin-antitoxin module
MSYERALSDYSRQKITTNNRVYLPSAVRSAGFKAGEEVEISLDRENKTVKLELLEQ